MPIRFAVPEVVSKLTGVPPLKATFTPPIARP
jgi:hypothetical protein